MFFIGTRCTARHYAIHITASQFLNIPRDTAARVARSYNCEFAAICHARFITETMQDSAKVTMECEYEQSYAVYLLASFPMTMNDPNSGFKVAVFSEGEYFIQTMHLCQLQIIHFRLTSSVMCR